MREIIQSFQKKLVDLTQTNRSLFQNSLRSGKEIDLFDFDFSAGLSAFAILSKIIAQKVNIPLCKTIDSRDGSNNALALKLRNLLKNQALLEAETGFSGLYIAYPFVNGKWLNQNFVRCPLAFFPIQIYLENDTYFLSTAENQVAFINKTFLLAYSFFQNQNHADLSDEAELLDAPTDSTEFRTFLYNYLKNNKIEINFNREIFEDKIKPFFKIESHAFENEYGLGELKLSAEAVIGLYNLSGSVLWNDYQEILLGEIPSVKDFLQTPNHKILPSYINHVKEENTFTPLESDIFQENAIKASKSGVSLVLQGPPGTGKSQTIANLVADFIASKKNILVVCQKKVALEVVQERLKSIGLGQFVQLINDFRADRKDVFQKLETQIAQTETYKKDNYSLDTVFLERSVILISRNIEKITQELDEFRTQLFETSAGEISAKELYLSASTFNCETISLSDVYADFPASKWLDTEQLVRRASASIVKYDQKDFIWNKRVSFAKFGFSDLQEMKNLLSNFNSHFQALQIPFESLFKRKIVIQDIFELLDLFNKTNSILQVLISIKEWNSFEKIPKKLSEKNLAKQKKQVLNVFQNRFFIWDWSQTRKTEIKNALLAWNKAQESWLEKIKFGFSSQFKTIKEVLKIEKKQLSKTWVNDFLLKIANNEEFDSLIFELQTAFPFLAFNPTMDLDELKQQFKILDHLYLQYNSIVDFKKEAKLPDSILENVIDFLEDTLKLLSSSQITISQWKFYLSKEQIFAWHNDSTICKSAYNQLVDNFENLVSFDQLKENLGKNELLLVNSLAHFQHPEQVFHKSIRLAWLEHLERKSPVLQLPSTDKIRFLEEDLQKAVLEKRKIANQILLIKAKERAYRNLNFNRLQNQTTYRELKHQVSKKKKLWSLRKVIESYKEEVFDLVPCWLASPESVSAIFPLEKCFDLVIFDEASQFFIEKAIPSLYRGKQILIAGDSKQLTPNDLYKIRWEENDETHLETQMDSLLDLGVLHLPQIYLCEHYRSKHEALISFSNQKFYDHKLRIIPEKKHWQTSEIPIVYHLCKGTWSKQTNQIEAETLVSHLMDELKRKPDLSVGIITLNFPQQELIEELLLAKSSELKLSLPLNLIVKNIENIQGDERDVIYLSIAYAPDRQGNMQMNFGSLNREGGENRLNVAITRAREKIHIFTSLLPHELKTENTKYLGASRLKEYLEYAHHLNFNPKLAQNRQELNQENELLLKNILAKESNKKAVSIPLFADWAYENEAKDLVCVFTDDNKYYSSLSSKDIYAYLPLVLEKKGWTIERSYSRNYWKKSLGH